MNFRLTSIAIHYAYRVSNQPVITAPYPNAPVLNNAAESRLFAAVDVANAIATALSSPTTSGAANGKVAVEDEMKDFFSLLNKIKAPSTPKLATTGGRYITSSNGDHEKVSLIMQDTGSGPADWPLDISGLAGYTYDFEAFAWIHMRMLQIP